MFYFNASLKLSKPRTYSYEHSIVIAAKRITALTNNGQATL